LIARGAPFDLDLCAIRIGKIVQFRAACPRPNLEQIHRLWVRRGKINRGFARAVFEFDARQRQAAQVYFDLAGAGFEDDRIRPGFAEHQVERRRV
jgi:hypothetical protein